MNTITINLDDGKIRATADGRLPQDEYQRMRAVGFRWNRREQVFAAAWSPAAEDTALAILELTPDDIELDEVDAIERAQVRQADYETYAGNAQASAQAAGDRADAISRRFEMGQPILIGHHSEAGARRDQERMWDATRKSIDEGHRADYWAGRAAGTLRRAERRYTPAVISRRIDTLEAKVRDFQRRLELTPGSTHAARWLDFTQARLALAKRQLEQAEAEHGRLLTQDDVNPGDAVKWHNQWFPVVRANKKTVTVGNWLGTGSPYDTYKLGYDKLTDHRTAAQLAETQS